MEHEVVMYHGIWDKMRQEYLTDFAINTMSYVFQYGPTVLKYYLLVSFVWFVYFEIYDTCKRGWNGIGNGVWVGLKWPITVMSFFYHRIWSNNRCHRRNLY